MKFHRPGHGRFLAFPLLITAAAVAGTLAFNTASSASSASSQSPGASASPLAGTLSSALYKQGLEFTRPAARTGPHISEQAAVAAAQAQPIAPSHGVQQAALAHVTFYRMRPAISGLFWVISLKPAGNIPSNGLPGRHPQPRKAKYYYVVINAVTGHFTWASIGG